MKPYESPFSRREMLRACSLGFGTLAFHSLIAREARVAKSQTNAARTLDHAPRAKHVIFAYMSGGVSHVDSFDPKPELVKRHGHPMPVPVKPTMFNNNGNIMASPWEARPRGKSGVMATDLFPHLAESLDDFAVIRSMTSGASEHAQGNYFFHTGFGFSGHPSAGAWMSYGLGASNENLPGFVVLQSGNASAPHGGLGLYSSGYLPAQHQASILRVDGAEPMANINPREPDGIQRRRLGFMRELDEIFLRTTSDSQVEAAIRNYETAYRMQAAVPELCELKGESDVTRKLYALDDPDPETAMYGRQCLVARRLVERGVRFVELSCLTKNIGAGNGPNPWDQHSKIKEGHGAMAHQVDRPLAGLVADLKSRGLWESTLLIWAGEFGRTPFSQGSDGRDHNPHGFTVMIGGGGIRGGSVYGATDELGYFAVDRVATVYDLYATVLHLLGIDHEKLTFRYGGRDFRLTDVHGIVIRDILA
jgi:hypothetical protein